MAAASRVTSVTAPPHRDADVRLPERRRIVDPVPGHRDEVTAALPGPDDAQLVLGGDARIDAIAFDAGAEGLGGQLVELLAADRLVAGTKGAELADHGERGQLVVAGDDHRADSRRPALGDGRQDLGTRRVQHADETDPDHHPLNGAAVGTESVLAIGQTQDAQGPAGHLLALPEDALPVRGRERPDAGGGALVQTVREHGVRGALGEGQRTTAAPGDDHGHAATLRGEGEFGDQPVLALELVAPDPALGRERQQRPLGRIADDPPGIAAAVLQAGARAERADAQRHAKRLPDPGVRGTPGAQDRTLRRVSGAGDLERLTLEDTVRAPPSRCGSASRSCRSR